MRFRSLHRSRRGLLNINLRTGSLNVHYNIYRNARARIGVSRAPLATAPIIKRTNKYLTFRESAYTILSGLKSKTRSVTVTLNRVALANCTGVFFLPSPVCATNTAERVLYLTFSRLLFHIRIPATRSNALFFCLRSDRLTFSTTHRILYGKCSSTRV